MSGRRDLNSGLHFLDGFKFVEKIFEKLGLKPRTEKVDYYQSQGTSDPVPKPPKPPPKG